MSRADTATDLDPEIRAISTVFAALKELDSEAQARVLAYVSQKLRLQSSFDAGPGRTAVQIEPVVAPVGRPLSQAEDEGGLEGVSPVAKRWMTRSGLAAEQLSELFSLGGDDIDLIARTVPGKSKSAKMRSVLLLKSIAAYLSSGAARVTHEELKEASLHYDAYDGSNFARQLASMASEVSGTKESGYSLTARGMAAATELVKSLLAPPAK